MSEFRNFSGKTVDEAMEEACRQLGVAREKLEIEILSGGSSGIFGLVGKKKAQVRARLREEINLLDDLGAAEAKPAARSERPAKPPKAPRNDNKPAQAPRQAARPEPAPEPEPRPEPVAAPRPVAEPQPAPAPVEPPCAAAVPESAPLDDFEEGDDGDAVEAVSEAAPEKVREPRTREERASAPQTPPQPITPELESLVREIIDRMLDGILGQIPEYEISGSADRVSVLVRDEENSGLLIGREGQTLAAIQYLVNRMVIRRHPDPVKVQINTGEYRERQDDNLRKMAIFLADKAKSLGRPQSTKPLSSYHRRVVHLALQEDEAISTRSKGDGPLKRVLIVPRGGKGESQNGQRS